MIAHVEFELRIPDDSAVEVRSHMDLLVLTIKVPNDKTALVQLSDALRRAVVAVDAQIATVTP